MNYRSQDEVRATVLAVLSRVVPEMAPSSTD
jgi:hypothetical protein